MRARDFGLRVMGLAFAGSIPPNRDAQVGRRRAYPYIRSSEDVRVELVYGSCGQCKVFSQKGSKGF